MRLEPLISSLSSAPLVVFVVVVVVVVITVAVVHREVVWCQWRCHC